MDSIPVPDDAGGTRCLLAHATCGRSRGSPMTFGRGPRGRAGVPTQPPVLAGELLLAEAQRAITMDEIAACWRYVFDRREPAAEQ